MPKSTVNSGASNAGDPEPVTQVRGEHGPKPADLPAGGVVAPEGWTSVEADPPEAFAPATPDYASMNKADLQSEAQARDLPTSGTKADIAARLTEHDAAQGGEG